VRIWQGQTLSKRSAKKARSSLGRLSTSTSTFQESQSLSISFTVAISLAEVERDPPLRRCIRGGRVPPRLAKGLREICEGFTPSGRRASPPGSARERERKVDGIAISTCSLGIGPWLLDIVSIINNELSMSNDQGLWIRLSTLRCCIWKCDCRCVPCGDHLDFRHSTNG